MRKLNKLQFLLTENEIKANSFIHENNDLPNQPTIVKKKKKYIFIIRNEQQLAEKSLIVQE